MGRRSPIIILGILANLFHINNGCQLEGVASWPIPIAQTILDIHRGVVLNTSTTGIAEINSVNHGSGLNGGPYLQVSHADSRFLMWTNDLYAEYEENETSNSMSITVNFRCETGETYTRVIWITVEDTNNNAPVFTPTDQLEFTIATPVPPGFAVTGCLEDITVRDIDLTTQRIDFGIEENPYFEIMYDASLSTTPKEFKAILRTTTFIRTLPEPITLRISATDVDQTNDPPITTYATVRIITDTQFEMPQEPVFSQTFYLANYTENNIIEHDPIYLQQGYDDAVGFSLEGDHINHFDLVRNGTQISVRVTSPLPDNVMLENQIFLIVRAERNYTSGASSTIIVQLPDIIPLEFERAHYTGVIIDNTIQLQELRLSQGHEGRVTVSIMSDHASNFNAAIQGSNITITMSPLNESVILENNFINLQVVASTDRSSASAIVTLEIIKDDVFTPAFDRALYTGTYSPTANLVMEQIVIVNGFDATVVLSLEGDHRAFFQIVQDGPNINLTASALPPEIYSEQQILLTIRASKPRTVGATAAIVVSLPEARILDFEALTYRGTLRNNILTLETIVLSDGYDNNVNFSISGDYARYFAVSNIQNQVRLNVATPLPANVIAQNNFIILTLAADGPNAVPASTTVLLEIIKEDISTPLFSRNIYYATYNGANGIDIENIHLIQGYDASVTFRIEGEHSQYFEIRNTENNVALFLASPIPPDVIFREKVISINMLADKELTVGANAAVLIRFPAELTEPVQMRFSQNTYTGTLEKESLLVENIVLDAGYQSGTEFTLTGDYAEYFQISNSNNVVSLSLRNQLPEAITDENNFLIVEIEARRARAVSVMSSVVIDIVKEIIEVPVFSEAYYRGTYAENGSLLYHDAITLSSGYDETVAFSLEGDFASLFNYTQSNNSLSLLVTTPIPSQILARNDRLIFTIVADKPNTINGNAAIIIEIQREPIPELTLLGFERVTYVGSIANNTATLDPIVLSAGFNTNVTFTLHGELVNYFRVTSVGPTVTIALANAIPEASIAANGIIVLELQASAPNAVTAHTTVVFTVVTQNEVAPVVELVFQQTHYTGSYSALEGLAFNPPISLSQGYDASVQFALEGENSQWFGLSRAQNSVTVTLTSAIPASVIASNHHLIFSVIAQRPGSATARTTVVIALVDDYTEQMNMLGFERVTYVGSIANNTATLDPIVLSAGFNTNVTFTLHGELVNYFRVTSVGPTVTIALANAIPEASIPANGIIVLELQASAPNAVTAHTTVVFTVVTQNEVAPVVELVFQQTHYTGSYSALEGLAFNPPISLSQGYDASVQFALEGENSQWFGLSRAQNSVTVTLTSAIPASVIANNHHLIFSVTAQRPGSATARTTVVIALVDDYTEQMNMLGFERVTYVGSIANNTATLDPIVLSAGFNTNVTFTLHGELVNYFRVTSVGPTVTIALANAIPEASIPANGIIVLELQASAPNAVTAHTTVVFTVVTQNEVAPVVELVFQQTHYTGSYSALEGLAFNPPISLSQGYDASVQFALEGENSQWFGLSRAQNSVTVTLTSAIPASVIANNHHLIFSVIAQRPGSATARTTVVIALVDDYTEQMNMLGFERVTYVGSIANNTATLDPIVLSAGFNTNVTFTLHGELVNYFRVTSVGPTVTIALANAIPEASIPANGIIVLELQASAPNAVTAHTTVVFTVVTQNEVAPVVELVFQQTHYTGSYSALEGLAFNPPISLSQGYDASVQFALEGENSQWFGLSRAQNSVTVTLTSAIPASVIANNHHLIFSVTAQRPGSATARTTVVIALVDDYTEQMNMLGFERVTYVGSIANNTATLDPIVLSAGFNTNVTFTLHGELVNYFRVTSVGPTVTIALANAIPEASIPANGIIVLELQASAPNAVTAHTTVVFTVVTQNEVAPVVELVFQQTHYTGSYSALEGLAFNPPISLSQGYDASVQFALEGENSQWFGLSRAQNSVTVTLTSAIPASVIANNHHLIFSVIAQRPGSATARTTVVIALVDDYTEQMNMLGFERVTYVGSIANNTATLDPIVLSAGFNTNVTFTLHGELVNYFRVTSVGPTVTIALANAIPEASIPANGIIVLELQASAPNAVTAHTTVVFTVVTQNEVAPVVELVFQQTHYTGSYSALEGLAFNPPISLSQGYDASVQFALEGENSQWFGLSRAQNSVTVTLTSAIPASVIANNHHLIFSVTAQRPGSATARTTVVIALVDDYTEQMNMLGFERVTYVGSIANNTATLDPIVLSAGFNTNVTFTLHGELVNYFRVTSVGPTVTIALANAIPEASIPANGIIVLELQASAPNAVTAHTTVVFTVVTQNEVAPVVELVFQQTHYTGSYSALEGLAFNPPISLSQGYDASVQFALEGENSQWFGLSRAQNSVTVTLTSAIPASVIANNHHLIFSVTAQRPGSATARTTVVIALVDDYTEQMNMLGFERVTYVGSIANNTATLDPIVLSAGFNTNVTFTLHGELVNYFRVTSVGPTVTIALANAIPEASIPANGIIVLELQASAPNAVTAHTTVVFTVVTQNEVAPVVELVFQQTHYTGSYSALEGLAFNPPISLSQGYDASVQFALEGENSQWFGLSRAQNSVTVTLTSAIPASVIANNHHLIFSVIAQRPGSATARTTVVIALVDDYTEQMNMLGFERVTYVGSIANNTATLDPIVLSAGFNTNVTFTLHGELVNYFRVTSVGPTVTIALANAIPEASIPANGIIVLELQASAPNAVTAHTTVVFTVVTQNEVAPVVELVFQQTHYTGSYSALEGLAFNPPISLSQGYDASVQFALEGENSQWFGLSRAQNSVTVTLTSAIPASVIANNHHLIFSVTAQRPGSATARTTVVIALVDDYTEQMNMLGFERVTYVGSIANNTATLDPIVLSAGFNTNVTFTLHGELVNYFRVTSVGPTVTIALANAIPEASIPANGIIVLELQASAPNAVTAHTTVVFTVVTQNEVAPVVELVFQQTHYTGSYSALEGLAFNPPISLSQGYDASVQFALEGENSQWFGLSRAQNSVTVTLTSAIPASVIASNHHLIFSVIAQRPGSATARTTVVIALVDDYTEQMNMLGFERVTYVGSIANNTATLDPIVLSAGFNTNVTFTLHGELVNYFRVTSVGPTVTIALANAIPEASIPANGIIVLELQASAPNAVTAHTTVVFTVVTQNEVAPVVELVFQQTHYTGSYSALEGLAFNPPISLSQGYDASVQFALEGENSQWFGLSRAQNSVTVTLTSAIPASVIANNHHLIFSVIAQRPGSATARTTVVIALVDDYTEQMNMLGFERVTYVGSIANNTATLDPIVLSAGFNTNVTFTLHGELVNYFRVTSVGPTVTIALANAIPEASIPANGIIVLELQASAPNAVTAHTTVVFTVVTQNEVAPVVELVFQQTHYTGSYSALEGLAFNPPISLSQGYDASVQFALEGENSQWFGLSRAQNSVTVTLTSAIPASVIANNHHLIFSVTAQRPGSATARTTVIISLNQDTEIELSVSFDKVLYEGVLQNENVRHEDIILTGFNRTTIDIYGEFANLFSGSVSEGAVVVAAVSASVTNVSHVSLELRADTARAVLVLTVLPSDSQIEPIVTFSATSYSLRVDNVRTGLIGRVVATADNGEPVRYTITSNDHLMDRLSINENGEIFLSAPAESGNYSALVTASTVFTQARAQATVYLTVQDAVVCGEGNLPPLIIIERDEEAPHRNLVVMNETQHPGCWYTLGNRWPVNQTWLYLDEVGLHARPIDREHESIAFMALSQVQVELTLHCGDENLRMKRSVARPDWLGPYDYGNNEWILTNSIPYNPRRSIVNLIVNDINDNHPVFIGKENEPIAVGYPIDELVETVMPRSLVELQATDADVGINAALVYWSTEDVISVARTSGFVHVRDGARLENDTRLVIHATDRNGEGLSGAIEILVKLLNTENIVVLTIRDAFLEDERNILTELSSVIGYDVKVLRSTVMPDGAQANQRDSSRKRRNAQPTGSSLQLYIYGMIEREPVTGERLTSDINNNAIVAVTVASVVSLQDYLEGREICVIPGRDTGLLVATILLSILLFILIVLIATWFILQRRSKKNYDQFSDQNSIASRNETLSPQPKPVNPPKPRLNIDELKKSERRLQDMLQAPIVDIKPSTSKKEPQPESILDIPPPDSPAPIVTVIQSIDKLKDATDESDTDEFGEIDTTRRKSVVTFNENVEKIIHVEDTEDLSPHPGYEIYKL